MGKDMRHFLKLAREAGPDFYLEVKKPIKTELEVSILQEKLADQGHFPVLFCPQIEGSKLPLVAGVFASYEMMGLALDMTPQQIKAAGKAGVFDQYYRRRYNPQPPRTVSVSEAPVREVVMTGNDVDLDLLPIIHHARLDSGKYITIGQTICKDPDTGLLNVGIYRRELKGKDSLGWMLDPGQRSRHIVERYAELGRLMEWVTYVGHHPMTASAAVTKGSNKFDVMGALLGEPLELVPALTVDLLVPARAEIVLEGVMDPREKATDGPFGEFYGYYGGERPCYLTKVTAITMRHDAIYHDLDSLHPEHSIVGVLGREFNLYNAIKNVVPAVKAVHCGPEERCLRNFIYVSIKKSFEGEGKRAGLAALTTDFTSKIAIVVDEDIDVYDDREVLWAVGTRTRADRDITIIPRLLSPTLNPAALNESGTDAGHVDAKVLIDATRPTDLPFATRVTPPEELWDSLKLEDYLK